VKYNEEFLIAGSDGSLIIRYSYAMATSHSIFPHVNILLDCFNLRIKAV